MKLNFKLRLQCYIFAPKYTSKIQVDKGTFKYIVFDLGGVLVDIDPVRAIRAFARLGGIEIDDLENRIENLGLFHEYEIGQYNHPEFRDRLRTFLPNSVSDEEIDKAWSSLILDVPQDRIDLLESLKQRYQLFVLSNTNPFHIQYINQQLIRSGNPSLESIFQKVYYSYLLHMTKPSPEIYQHITKENGLEPSELLFLDDTLANINTARVLGWETIHINTPRKLFELFDHAHS